MKGGTEDMDGRGEGEEMKPCPYCGHRGAIISLPHYRAGCWNARCWAWVELSNWQYPTEGAAIAAWNRRAPTVSTPEPSPALEGYLSTLSTLMVEEYDSERAIAEKYIRAYLAFAGPPQGVEALREAVYNIIHDSFQDKTGRILALLPRNPGTWTKEEIRAAKERAEAIDKEIGWTEPRNPCEKEEG